MHRPIGTDAVLTGLLVLAAACGSPLDNPISNIAACQELNLALRDKCTTDDFEWLNCDVLPGCPSGQVESAGVSDCVSAIQGATDCAAALKVECSIAKSGCAGAAGAFADPIGYDAACTILNETFGPRTDCGETGEDLCSSLLGCDRSGAFERSAIESARDLAAAETTCDNARTAIRSTVDGAKKYCFQVVQ